MPPVPKATLTLLPMRKLLIPVTAIASVLLVACSGDPVVNRLPWVYRIDIQQGNVISEDAVNQLRPGMNRRQVQFLMGTPLLADPFHANRWDYFYQFEPGSRGEGEAETKGISLFFEEGRLTRISGTLEPNPAALATAAPRQVTVDVPPQEIADVGVLTRLWRWIGFGRDPDDYRSDETTTNRESSEPAQQAPPVY